jgi:hypothetical protein
MVRDGVEIGSAMVDVLSAMLFDLKLKRATKYLRPDLVVKLTRALIARKNARGETLHLTYGKPNFAERRFIRLAAGEPFPVKKVQLKAFPKKRVK